MYPGYQPKPDDVFHAVGYTTRDISDNTHFRLHGISDRVRMENEDLWRQLGPLVRAMQSGKVKREFVEVLSVDPFLGNYEIPYTGLSKEMFLSIEYLSDAAFRLAAGMGYGIRMSSRRSKELTFQGTTESPFVPSITAEFETCASA